MRRLRVVLLLGAAALAYVLARRPKDDFDIWEGIEKDWY